VGEIEDRRQERNAAEDALETSRRARRIAEEELRSAQTEAARRVAVTNTGIRDVSVDAAVKAAQNELKRANGREQRAAGAFRKETQRFATLTRDPIGAVTALDVALPLLLMPLRLETRFIGGELLVRVYPDEWAIDTFETDPTDNEARSLQQFWEDFWIAGTDEPAARSVWGRFARAHGTTRAVWLARSFQPTNAAPTTAPAGTVTLVVARSDLSAAENAAIEQFWTEVYAGGGVITDDAMIAFVGDVGEERAKVLAAHRPGGMDRAAENAGAPLRFVVAQMPRIDTTKTDKWTTAARAALLPDRFVLVGRRSGKEILRVVASSPVNPRLALGPDPRVAKPDTFHLSPDGDLVYPEELAWMFDFDKALDAGLGFRIVLDATTTDGFDELFAVGIRSGVSPKTNAKELSDLFLRHQASSRGFALVGQGTPTNNTEAVPSGHGRVEDPDRAFDRLFRAAPTPAHAEHRSDAEHLAIALGIPLATFADTTGNDLHDQQASRAAAAALWPATWGYYLASMCHGVLSRTDIETARTVFCDTVRARGPLPTIRIGRQPFGILPTSARSRLGATFTPTGATGRVYTAIDRITRAVETAATANGAQPVTVNTSGDPQQTLLDIVATQASSVEFHQRYAESGAELWNRSLFFGVPSAAFATLWEEFGFTTRTLAALRTVGYKGTAIPPVALLAFHERLNALNGPVIDEGPASETVPLRKVAPNGNYIEWLHDAAGSSLDTLRLQRGFTDDNIPKALLYLLLHHSAELVWRQTAIDLREANQLLTAAEADAARRDVEFLHIDAKSKTSQSQWQTLYSPATGLTNTTNRKTLADVIASKHQSLSFSPLAAYLDALKLLAPLFTSQLERLLAEHLDLCSYRLDAWLLAPVNQRLADLRTENRDGLHLGAYGWLLNVHRATLGPQPIPPTTNVPKVLRPDDPATLQRDPSNAGYVHAPSINHAITASILRAGHHGNATPTQPGLLNVQISSRRMRDAVAIVEGLREGQSLGALLGYRFERSLHDRAPAIELNRFIAELRKLFPTPSDPQRHLVVDGVALVRHLETVGTPTIPGTTSTEAAALREAYDALRGLSDAVADLAVAESVHQLAQGNLERAAATLDSYGRGALPPEPDVLATPRSGSVVTHRFAIHLPPTASPTMSPVPGIAMTPRAIAEPRINSFLAGVLPDPATVAVRVRWGSGTDHRDLTQIELGLQPADLLALVNFSERGGGTVLDERIAHTAVRLAGLGTDVAIGIAYTEQVVGFTTMFELSALLSHLRRIVTASRPLRPSDAAPGDGQPATPEPGRLDRSRVSELIDAIDDWDARATAAIGALRSLGLGNPTGAIDTAEDLLIEAARFAVPDATVTPLHNETRSLVAVLSSGVDNVLQRWDRALEQLDEVIARHAALPPGATDADRLRLLLGAERLVRATETDPTEVDPAVILTTIQTARAAFVQRRGELVVLGTATDPTAIATAAATALPIGTFDTEAFELDATDAAAAITTRIASIVSDAADRLASTAATLGSRRSAATTLLAQHDAPDATDTQRVDSLRDATRALIDASVLVVPAHDLNPAEQQHWTNAHAWSNSGDLTAHLDVDAIDDWLNGLAVVRAPIGAYEQASVFATVLGRRLGPPTPLQFPHANEAWIGTTLDPTRPTTGERVCYTATFSAAFNPTEPIAGLLLDDWTETIPTTDTTTALGFHYDRPDSEPPNVMLLALAPDPKTGWHFDDLTDTLLDTLALTRLRALGPDAIAATNAAPMLPATIAQASVGGLSLAMNLAHNNGLLQAWKPA
jgi:hypothetical protein